MKKIIPFLILIILLTSCANSANDNSVKAVPTTVPTTVPITTGVIGNAGPFFGKWKVKDLLFVDDTGYLDYFHLETPNISYLDNVIGSEIYIDDNAIKLNGTVVLNKPEFQVYNRNMLPPQYASSVTMSINDFYLSKQNNYLSLLYCFVDKSDNLLMVLYSGTEKNNTGRDRVLGNVYRLVR